MGYLAAIKKIKGITQLLKGKGSGLPALNETEARDLDAILAADGTTITLDGNDTKKMIVHYKTSEAGTPQVVTLTSQFSIMPIDEQYFSLAPRDNRVLDPGRTRRYVGTHNGGNYELTPVDAIPKGVIPRLVRYTRV